MPLTEGHWGLCFCIFVAVSLSRVSLSASDWSYDDRHGDNGPRNWKKTYPECGKSQQSPIDIRTSRSKYKQIEELELEGYDSTPARNSYTLTNNGHTVQLSIANVDMNIAKADLSGKYKLVQFHVHWGSTNSKGSEHTINGRSYPMEIHFVHYSTDRYSNIGQALSNSDGLAVVGVFAEIGDKSHPIIEKLIQKFCDIKYSGSNTTDVDVFQMADLLPDNRKSFYRYTGSLTTPGCQESVIWTVLQQPIKVSQTQLNAFRALGHYAKGYKRDVPMEDNFRPVQPLGTRILLRNHDVGISSEQPVSNNEGSSANNIIVPALFGLALAAGVAIVCSTFRREDA